MKLNVNFLLTSCSSLQVFFVTGFNITVQLMNVSLIGPLLSSPPRVRLDAKIALVSVPEEAANAEVSFHIPYLLLS